MEDLLLDDNNDLILRENGDFAIGPSAEQHQALLLNCNKGDFRESPTTCVGAARWLKEENLSGLLSEIKTEFERDGMVVSSIQLVDDKLSINANYKTSSDNT